MLKAQEIYNMYEILAGKDVITLAKTKKEALEAILKYEISDVPLNISVSFNDFSMNLIIRIHLEKLTIHLEYSSKHYCLSNVSFHTSIDALLTEDNWTKREMDIYKNTTFKIIDSKKIVDKVIVSMIGIRKTIEEHKKRIKIQNKTFRNVITKDTIVLLENGKHISVEQLRITNNPCQEVILSS